MNIVYLINYAGKAGTEKYVENCMRFFSEKGDECHLVYSVPGALSQKMQKAGFPVKNMNLSAAAVLKAALDLARYCRENRIDVIHAQYPRENVIALLAQKLYSRVRVVFTSHLTIHQGVLWRCANRLMTPKNSCVISLCEEGRRILVENGVCEKRIRIVPNGIGAIAAQNKADQIRREFCLSRETVVFLTMARCVPEKGLSTLVHACSILRKKTDSPFACLVAGDGPEFEKLREEIRNYGLEKYILQAGYREDTDILYASADAYICPSLRNEAMSFAILEAMGHGLPLAVTSVGAGKELAEGCGFVCHPGDAEGMAEVLLQLMDSQKREVFGAAARKKAEECYRLEVVLEKLYSFYGA